MLSITRKEGEEVVVTIDNVNVLLRVKVLEAGASRATLVFDAPGSVGVWRKEIWEQKVEEMA